MKKPKAPAFDIPDDDLPELVGITSEAKERQALEEAAAKGLEIDDYKVFKFDAFNWCILHGKQEIYKSTLEEALLTVFKQKIGEKNKQDLGAVLKAISAAQESIKEAIRNAS